LKKVHTQLWSTQTWERLNKQLWMMMRKFLRLSKRLNFCKSVIYTLLKKVIAMNCSIMSNKNQASSLASNQFFLVYISFFFYSSPFLKFKSKLHSCFAWHSSSIVNIFMTFPA
jgi:hypothetical protein